MAAESAIVAEAPQTLTGRTVGQLIWRRFRRNKLARTAGIVIAILLVTAVLAPFLSTMNYSEQSSKHLFAPPQRIYFRDHDSGRLTRPYVYNLLKARDRETLRITYTEDREQRFPILFFRRGEPYRILWIIPGSVRLMSVGEGARWNFWGTDSLGRDLYSRVLRGSQVSLSVPFVGTFLTILIGSVMGMISGYFAGRVDHYIQRFIEVLIALPSLPLWLALAAAMPLSMPSGYRYLLIVVILSIIDWGGLARVVRGKVLQYRGGLGRIIFRHLVPGTLSHLIVVSSLSIPGVILGESALSFLGVGITPPLTSWGVLLQDAQKIEVLIQHRWLVLPGIFIVVTVLAFNFFGDGVRDAADPYS